jgi:hypothetical protein
MLRAILMGLVALLMMSPAAMAAPDTTPSDTSEIMQTDTAQPAGIELTELAPRYVTDSSERRVGVSFDCPSCRLHRVVVMVDPPFDSGLPAEHPWARRGEAWATLTLSPSVVAHRRDQQGRLVECWHGHIRSGRAV